MLTENKNILIKSKSKKWFTLVELIIVITILAILATISFISFQGYTKNTRDANRLASMNSMSKWLEIYLTKNSVLPHPENPITIYDNSETIWYQGYFWDDVARLTWFDKNPKDPLDGSKYTYLTSSDYKKYQILSLMETSDYLTFSNDIFPKTFADWVNYSKRIPKTIGYDLWVLLWNWANEINKPVQEITSLTWVNIDTDISYKAIINNTKTIDWGNIKILKNTIKNNYDSSLIWYWDMETTYSSWGIPYIKDLSGNWVDCQSNIWNKIVPWLKWEAIRTTTWTLAAITCTPNMWTWSSFSLFYTYKVNSLDSNAILNENNISPYPSSWLFWLNENAGNKNNISSFIYNWTFNQWTYVKSTWNYYNDSINNINYYNWNILSLVYEWNWYKLYNNWSLIYSKSNIDYIKFNKLVIPRWVYTSNTWTFLTNIYWDVNIDDIRLYNKALTDNEVAKIYNQMK